MKMPVMFIGHGSPLNIIENNSYTKSLAAVGKKLLRPEAIVVVSAHWLTSKTYITAAKEPPTIYDFYGFPEELYQAEYNCPGLPEMAAMVEQYTQGEVICDQRRGIDHAAWAVLKHMYPEADIPVLEISLDVNKSAREHYELGKKLAPLREKGVLIMGSGDIVHNLALADFFSLYGEIYPWAADFDNQVAGLLMKRDHQGLIHYEQLAHADLAVPTNEHYLPLLYTVALQEEEEKLSFFCTDMQNAAISMRSFLISDRTI